jgi:hypothetical protein
LEIVMPNLALYTFGMLHGAYNDERLTDFVTTAPSVYAEVEASDGFIAHAGMARRDLRGNTAFGQDYGPWGVYVVPRYYTDDLRERGEGMIQTLSLWRSFDSARRFAYGGLHRQALKRRTGWFQSPAWPGYVLWWVDDDAHPTWSDGVRRLEDLANHGAGPSGFTFAHAYDAADRS